MKNISTTGLCLIKNFEGLRLHAYRCPAGVLTIGYGHTQNVKENDVITYSQADLYLYQDVQSAVKSVNKYDDIYNFSQNEFDALVSFTFNCGVKNLNLLLDKGNRDKKTIAEKMLLYNKANKKVVQGLVNRRKAEQQLFLQR